MIRCCVAIALVFAGLLAKAQPSGKVSQEAFPQGGVDALALEYYRIDFTKEQRQRLRDVRIEFIYQIDPQGVPILAEINGVSDRDLVDSLRSRTPMLPRFNPRILEGTPQSALYIMQLVFPAYPAPRPTAGELQTHAYHQARLEDFDYIHKSGQRFDMNIGGTANLFAGRAGQYLAPGGGMKIDLAYTAVNQLLYGLNMSFYGNRLKQEYPLAVNREQLPAPVTLMIGAVFGKWFNRFSAQLELNLAYQNVTERLGDIDTAWVQLSGWSPGLVINYPLQLGRERPQYYYGSPVLLAHQLNFHLGVRPVFLSIREATGAMLEVGVSYRMGLHMVDRYKLKESFGN